MSDWLSEFRSLKYEDAIKYMTNKENISRLDVMFKESINIRRLLMAILIHDKPEDTIEYRQVPGSYLPVRKSASHVVSCLESRNDSELVNVFSHFSNLFEKWKSMDAEVQIQDNIQSYQRILVPGSDVVRPGNEKMAKFIRSNLRLLRNRHGVSGTTLLDSATRQSYDISTIEELSLIGANACYKAYHDVLVEEIMDGSYVRLVTVVTEIRTKFQSIRPSDSEIISSAIDVEILSNILNNRTNDVVSDNDVSYIKHLGANMVDLLKMYGRPMEDKVLDTWYTNICDWYLYNPAVSIAKSMAELFVGILSRVTDLCAYVEYIKGKDI